MQEDIMTITKIKPSLYLGSGKHPRRETPEFKELGIDVIINCCNDFRHKPNKNYIIEQFAIDDGTDASIIEYLNPIAEIINYHLHNNKKIYVHCVHGRSRSVSIIIYYLMKYHKKSFDEAFSEVRALRPVMSPNTNFIRELKEMDFYYRPKTII